jgi:hypothetical protein
VDEGGSAPCRKRIHDRNGSGTEDPRRSLLAIALILASGIASLWLWGAGHAQRMAASSSQIFIHGTPVCVTQRGGDIVAAVGVCGEFSGNPHGGSGMFHGSNPLPGDPGMGLPPGHPPIDEEPLPVQEGGKRTLI